MVSIAQFSDLHLSRPGNRSHGGFGYDTDRAWEHVFRHAFVDNPAPDRVVITGDVADHGEVDEYAIAAERLARIPVPANALPGNHDYDTPLRVGLPGSGVTMERIQRIGPWMFLFVDSNAEYREPDPTGRLVDTAQRIATNGLLGAREVGWIDEVIAASDAEHVWLWMHHPPAMAGFDFHSPAFDVEIEGLVERHERIRGIGAGHVHTDMVRTIGGVEVHLCPALTINLDLVNWKTMPPGYLSWEFNADGSFRRECHLLPESEHWPVFDLPEPIVEHMLGKLTWDEMMVALDDIRAALEAMVS